jgi:tripartite-type tricarboxylate transporter receptor subunit TctC
VPLRRFSAGQHALSNGSAASHIRRVCALALALIGICSLAPPGHALAQDYPARPITLIVPFPPGGSTDIAGRTLAQKLSAILNQSIVIENRAGAAGAIGIRAVSLAAPDGYTLGVSGVGTSAILESLGRKLDYSPDRDLAYVGHMGSSALVIASRADLQAKTLADLIALAKSNPDGLTYGTSGAGSPGHLAMELLLIKAGIKIRHIPYKGNAPLLNDLVGKHIDTGVLTIPGTGDQVKAGKLLPLAVTGAARSSELADVPAVQELGFKDFSAELWNVLVAPKNTPQAVVDKLNAALATAMADPAVQSQFKTNGLVPVTMTPAQTKAFVDVERTKWADVIKTSGITAE